MIINDKQLKSLIKKTQKKCNVKKKPLVNEEIEENVEANNMFREMKKLPFKE